LKEQLAKGLSLFVNLTPQFISKKVCGEITPIFMLHRLSNPDQAEQAQGIEHLKWCLAYIRKHRYQPISLTQLATAYSQGEPLPPKSVVFTIDDGFFDQAEIAAPIFNQFDIPYTCFVITDFLDGKLWPWDDQISYVLERTKQTMLDLQLPTGEPFQLDLTKVDRNTAINLLRHNIKLRPQEKLYDWLGSFYQLAEVDRPDKAPDIHRPMTWQQAQQLIDQGHEIAPHTKTHRILSRLSDEEAEDEILGSFARVNTMLEGSSKLFAYPTGRPQDYTPREKMILSKASAIATVNTTANYSMPSDAKYDLPRFPLAKTRFDYIQYLSFFDRLKRNLLSHRYADEEVNS